MYEGEYRNMDFYGFYTGKIFDAYEYLGCHLVDGGAVFRTFAPAAAGITVMGEFNGWTETEMHRTHDGNFWDCYIPGVKDGMLYKYKIYKRKIQLQRYVYSKPRRNKGFPDSLPWWLSW